MSIEENGLLDVDNNVTQKQQGPPSLFRSKVIIISFAAILGLIVVGLTIGLSVALSHDKDKDNNNINNIERVPEGYSKLEGTDIYVFGNNDPVIIVLPDINGASPEAKNITAHFSQAGFTAILIDYFNGNISFRPAANVSLSYSLSIIKNLYKRGYTSIQVQGYCYGGRIGVSLSSMESIIRTCAVAHPSSLTKEDAEKILSPIFFELASVDGATTLVLPYFNETLQKRGEKAEYKIYPNTTHGFAVSSTINPQQKQICLEDSTNWFLSNK